MIRIILTIVLSASCDICASQEKVVECQGNTVIKVDDRIGAQTSFHAVFKIEGDSVTMTEGDFFRFATSYKASSELTRPGRPGYQSNNGNLFFYIDSGRFMIYKLEYLSGIGNKSESTTGECKKFGNSDVFK